MSGSGLVLPPQAPDPKKAKTKVFPGTSCPLRSGVWSVDFPQQLGGGLHVDIKSGPADIPCQENCVFLLTNSDGKKSECAVVVEARAARTTARQLKIVAEKLDRIIGERDELEALRAELRVCHDQLGRQG